MSSRFKVYLAGPISGCTSDQSTHWRHAVKNDERWIRDFDFVDPTDSLVGSDATPYEIVDHDLQAIAAADGVLVNMWKESIGTAIGVVHARAKGKVVVVADPNRLRNRSLAYYADSVFDTVPEAVHALRHLLRMTRGVIVIKRGGGEEPFSRGKLTESIRAGCRAAGLDDIVVPSLVLVRLGKELTSRMRSRTVNRRFATSEIEGAILAAISELEGDRGTASAVRGLKAAWKQHVATRRRTFRLQPNLFESLPPPPRQIRVYSPKSHATIWGKAIKSLADVPSKDARRALQVVTGVDGVAEIVLREMREAAPRESGCICMAASTSPFILEGKLYDIGKKGGLQMFQALVDRDDMKEQILATISTRLQEAALWTDR